MSDQKQDPEQFRINTFKWLHERARDRHQNRRVVEWKVMMGVWTALLVSAGMVVLKESSDLPPWTFRSAVVFAVVIFVATTFFEFWVASTQLFDSKLSYWYSTAIEDHEGIKATPPTDLRRGWRRFGEADPPKLSLWKLYRTWCKRCRSFCFGAQDFKIVVTFMLASLFVASIKVQVDRSSPDPETAPSPTQPDSQP